MPQAADWKPILGLPSIILFVIITMTLHVQMTVTSPEGADFVAGLGVDRVVVGRELSVREIAKVRRGAAGGAVPTLLSMTGLRGSGR